jgi:hypothetical protein
VDVRMVAADTTISSYIANQTFGRYVSEQGVGRVFKTRLWGRNLTESLPTSEAV